MNEVELLRFLVEGIVADKAAVKVERKEDDLGVLLTLQVAQPDMGTLIGRQGKTIQAVKTLLRVMGSKFDKRVNLKVVDYERPGRPLPAEQAA